MPLEDFTDCQMPFGAVATNLSTGRELWLTEGDIHLAVRASCSMPGLMAPVPHNGYWLVDGGVVNPVPISLTRAMGADIVIAVDLQHDAHLMQQDLMPVNLQSEDAEGEKLAARAPARKNRAYDRTSFGCCADGDRNHDHVNSGTRESP